MVSIYCFILQLKVKNSYFCSCARGLLLSLLTILWANTITSPEKQNMVIGLKLKMLFNDAFFHWPLFYHIFFILLSNIHTDLHTMKCLSVGCRLNFPTFRIQRDTDVIEIAQLFLPFTWIMEILIRF